MTKRHFKELVKMILKLEVLEEKGIKITSEIVETNIINICRYFNANFSIDKWNMYKEKSSK